MASLVGHSIAAFCISKIAIPKLANRWILWVGVICAFLPDIDVIGFNYGIAYESFWGHRGFTHSLLFALILSSTIALLWAWIKKWRTYETFVYMLFFFLCTLSHGILDALTNGGRGIAFFSPWNDMRYFFPWRPILVSPMGILNFFSVWGMNVLISEIIWIGIPSLCVLLIIRLSTIQSKHK